MHSKSKAARGRNGKKGETVVKGVKWKTHRVKSLEITGQFENCHRVKGFDKRSGSQALVTKIKVYSVRC